MVKSRYAFKLTAFGVPYAPTCDLGSANKCRDHSHYRCLRVRQSTRLWNVATVASLVRTVLTLAKWADFLAGSLTVPGNSRESWTFAYHYVHGYRASVGSLVVLVSNPPDSAGFLIQGYPPSDTRLVK